MAGFDNNNKRWEICLVVEAISPPAEGVSPPFLSLFVLKFEAGGDIIKAFFLTATKVFIQ
jgi:hypothetical protein